MPSGQRVLVFAPRVGDLSLNSKVRIHAVIDLLWESTDGGGEGASEAEIAAAWKPEIARRVQEIENGIAVTCPLAEVEADLRTVVGP